MSNIVVLGAGLVGWRDRSDIEIDMADIMRRKGVQCLTQGARRVDPEARRIGGDHGPDHEPGLRAVVAQTAGAMQAEAIVRWTRDHLRRTVS